MQRGQPKQQAPQNSEPFVLEKYLQQLGQALSNNKDGNARVKGQADQLMADSLSATYASFMQLLQPIIQDHAKQTELIKSLEKALGEAKKPEKKVPTHEMPTPKTK